ncbi:MAG TPA: FG-GAP-like repeat-containing protein, partial [Polyangiales bacterium]|nr:FG-GAP-like repeat-containing protein [Polyangiales bacterium]
VASAGDVNGDGFGDIVVGTWAVDLGGVNDAGRATVYFGNPGGLLSAQSWERDGTQSLAYLGSAVASAGDVNGDGFSDLIVGEPRYDNGNSDEGRALVYYGSRGILAPNVQAYAPGVGSMYAAGDVNGDGYADVLLTDMYFSGGNAVEGKVYVYHGGPTGIATTAAFSVEGNQDQAYLGWSAAAAGDVDGDGYGDIIIGAPRWDNGHTDEGKALVFRGGASGIPTGQTPWAVELHATNAQFGSAVQGIGDVNGDGFADVAVRSGQSTHVIRVFHGSAAGLSTDAAWVQTSCGTDCISWGSKFAGAGDVNGDGFGDFIVTDPMFGTFAGGAAAEGKLFVYHGSATGLPTTPSWQLESNLDQEFLGWSVASAGDVNADGFGDIIVGATGADHKGRAYVYLGRSTASGGLNPIPAWTTSSTAYSEYGDIVGSAGDLNGDGRGDVFVTARSYDGTFANQGMALVYLGAVSGGVGTAAWAKLGGAADVYCGAHMTGLGDVNADGYSDLLLLCGTTNDVYFGNGSDYTIGMGLRPQALRTASTTPITPGGRAASTSDFRAAMRSARGPMGRGKLKLQVEAKAFGTAFNGSSLTTTTTWSDSALGGAMMTLPVTSSAGTTPHYRMRLLYHPSSAPWAQSSRWIYGGKLGVSRGVHARLLP